MPITDFHIALSEKELPARLWPGHRLSDQELLQFCANNEPLRIEAEGSGELIVMSPAGSAGGGLEGDVSAELYFWARQDGRGKAFGPNAGFRLRDGSMRAADAAWVLRRSWDALTPEQQESYAPICPEFVIEVRSKRDSLRELQAKMRMWIGNGAELAWLIDLQRKVVEMYRPKEEPEVHEQPTSVQGSGLLLDLSWCWSGSGAEHALVDAGKSSPKGIAEVLRRGRNGYGVVGADIATDGLQNRAGMLCGCAVPVKE